MDPDADPDPAIFVIDLQDANKKIILKKVFLLNTFWRYNYSTSFFKDKKSKRRNQGFFYSFCLEVERSGSIRLSYGSGSGSRRPKNIRIRNTGWGSSACLVCSVERAQHQGEFCLPVSDRVHHCVLSYKIYKPWKSNRTRFSLGAGTRRICTEKKTYNRVSCTEVPQN